MRKNGKRLLIALSLVLIFFILVFFGAKYLTNRTLKQVEVKPIDIAKIAEGEYVGAAKINPVSAKVRVKVADGKINQIIIDEHFTGLGKKENRSLKRSLTSKN